jgi:AcrR family transcriptional regulator
MCQHVAVTATRATAPGRQTRDRILEVAWELVASAGLDAVRVADIAAAADVSRQLVYAHFANRAGLLTQMVRHRDQSTGFADQVTAATGREPVEALGALLRAWCEHIPQILPVARALEAAAGAEGAEAWRDRMAALHDTFRVAIARVEADGRLARGWRVAAATDWAWARCHISTYQHLVVERGWDPRDYTDWTVADLLDRLVSRE